MVWGKGYFIKCCCYYSTVLIWLCSYLSLLLSGENLHKAFNLFSLLSIAIKCSNWPHKQEMKSWSELHHVCSFNSFEQLNLEFTDRVEDTIQKNKNKKNSYWSLPLIFPPATLQLHWIIVKQEAIINSHLQTVQYCQYPVSNGLQIKILSIFNQTKEEYWHNNMVQRKSRKMRNIFWFVNLSKISHIVKLTMPSRSIIKLQ